MKHLFGRECSANRFRHDDEMREMLEEGRSQYISQQSQTTVDSRSSPTSSLQRIATGSPIDLTTPNVVPKVKLTVGRNAEGRLTTFDSQGNEVHMRAAKASPIENVSLVSPPDQQMSENIRKVKIAHPQVSVLTAKTALLACRGSVDRAIELMAQGSESPEAWLFSDDEIKTMSTKKNHLKLGKTTVTTPPRAIFAVSPTSESQNLRRKAIMDSLREDGGKRLRLSYGHGSSDESFLDTTLVPDAGEGSSTADLISDEQPVTQNNFDKICERECTPPPISSDESDQDEEFETYWDAFDEVYRCKSCMHESWSATGVCTGCGAGDDAYFDIENTELRRISGIVRNEYDESGSISENERDELVGDYLDYDSSAYDSMDALSNGKADTAYEVNSFIDDESQDSPDEEDDDPLDEEPDYKKKFEELEAIHRVVCNELVELENEHEGLEKAYADLEMDHEEMRRDFLGSDYESENSDEMDEHGALVIDMPPLEPVVAEVVIEHAQGESQQSDLSAERIQDRVEAFEAANEQSWHNISMVSVRANHTFEEVEL
jgi:hypothetical protein